LIAKLLVQFDLENDSYELVLVCKLFVLNFLM
jgi:hypothetical protein